MKVNVDLNMKVSVEFSDPDKAQAVFIDGDWKEVFWCRSDLNTIAEDISYAFSRMYINSYPPYFLEGFGKAVRHPTEDMTYIIEDDESGAIVITCEQDLETDYSTVD